MSHLKLISFSAENFELGSVLTYADAEEMSDALKMNEAFSLYFQWPTHSAAIAKLESGRAFPVTIDYDREEIDPEYFKTIIPSEISLKANETISFLFEIFNTAYRFVSKIEECVIDNFGKTHLYFRRPSEIKVANLRQAPRRPLHKEEIKQIRVQRGSEFFTSNIIEVGTRSLTIANGNINQGEIIVVEIGYDSIEFTVVRSSDKYSVLVLTKESDSDYLKFFSLFVACAYPNLKNKIDTNLSEVIAMYEASGFYSKGAINPKDIEHETKKLNTVETWKETNKSDRVLEMVAYSEEKKIIGSSCLAKAFRHRNEDYWVIHHLAVLTDPSTIKRTTDLYLWRIEFLLGLKSNFSVCCWYDSKSKWIDRIWTKFHRTCMSIGAYVHDIDSYTIDIDRSKKNKNDINFSTVKIGKLNRILVDNENYFAGVGPQLLNASGFLNHACFYEKAPDEEELGRVDATICNTSEQENNSYRVTVPYGHKSEFLKNRPKSNADRFCIFPSESLPHLLSSLMHSLAVMERKHEKTSKKQMV